MLKHVHGFVIIIYWNMQDVARYLKQQRKEKYIEMKLNTAKVGFLYTVHIFTQFAFLKIPPKYTQSENYFHFFT